MEKVGILTEKEAKLMRKIKREREYPKKLVYTLKNLQARFAPVNTLKNLLARFMRRCIP